MRRELQESGHMGHRRVLAVTTIIAAVLALVCATIVVADRRADGPSSIRVRSLEVEDDDGRVRVEIAVFASATSFKMRDRAGREKLRLEVVNDAVEDFARVVIFDGRGRMRAVFGATQASWKDGDIVVQREPSSITLYDDAGSITCAIPPDSRLEHAIDEGCVKSETTADSESQYPATRKFPISSRHW